VPKTILVIDDDPGIREFLKDHLEAQGYAVRTAEDGVSGVQAALGAPPDIVITDFQMPAGEGDTVFRRLRTNSKTEKTPIVFVTGMPEGDLKKKLPFVPPNSALLRKPLDLAELDATLGKLL